jgi:hypothetical protein
MKKIVFISIIIIVLGSMATVYADEPKIERIEGLIVLKNDWVSKTGNIPCISTYFHWKYLGGGFDLRYYGRGRTLEFQPYLTLNKGPWYGFIGYSMDDNHAQYVQTGMWYIKNFGKLNILADVRNWWSLDVDKARTYFDPYIQLLYPLPKPLNTVDDKFYFGLEGEVNHWWRGSHNWYLVGPVLDCNITKNLALFFRPSHEWDINQGVTKRAYRFRTGLIVKF